MTLLQKIQNLTWWTLDIKLKDILTSFNIQSDNVEQRVTLLEEDFEGISKSYETYVALLTQSGTNAPVATILENTIGDIIWTRVSTGLYKGTLTGAFLATKTAVYLTNGGNIAPPAIFNTYADTVNTITLKSVRADTGTVTDSLVNTATLEIRVYQ